MAVTVGDLSNYIGLAVDPMSYLPDGPEADELEDVQRALAVAESLVDDVFSNAYREVPEVIRDQVVLDTGLAVYKRRQSLSGQSQYAFEGGAPVFEPHDPLQRSWKTIRRYVSPF